MSYGPRLLEHTVDKLKTRRIEDLNNMQDMNLSSSSGKKLLLSQLSVNKPLSNVVVLVKKTPSKVGMDQISGIIVISGIQKDIKLAWPDLIG